MESSKTKEKIVELARNNIQSIGYHSFNYKQISIQLNIKNASIHHHYPTKEDLGLAVVEKDKQDFLDMISRVAPLTATEKVGVLLNMYRQFFNNGNKLCIIGAFGSAYLDIPEKIQLAAVLYGEIFHNWLTQIFAEGLDNGEFSFSSSSEDLSNLWITALVGSLQIGRIRGENYFNNLLETLQKTLVLQ